MLIRRNAEGVHGKKKVGNPCSTATVTKLRSARLVLPTRCPLAQIS